MDLSDARLCHPLSADSEIDDGDAYGMKVPVVKQKRIAAEAKKTCRSSTVCVCLLCVVIPFILDVRLVDAPPAGSHRRKVTQDLSAFLLRCACHNFSPEKDSAVPFPRRP